MKSILTSFLLIIALVGCCTNPPPEILVEYRHQDITIPYATLEKEVVPKSGITAESTEYDLILYIQILKAKLMTVNNRIDATIKYLEDYNARD